MNFDKLRIMIIATFNINYQLINVIDNNLNIFKLKNKNLKFQKIFYFIIFNVIIYNKNFIFKKNFINLKYIWNIFKILNNNEKNKEKNL